MPLPRGRERLDGFGRGAPRDARGAREPFSERSVREAPFSFDPDPEATARSSGSSGSFGTWTDPNACVLKRGVTDAQAQAVLDYACYPRRTDAPSGFSCAAIKKGGDAFIPNTKRDHASWAVSRFFQARAFETDAFPQQDCHFSGVATLDVPGNYYLTADGDLTRANHALDALVASSSVPDGGVFFDTAEPFHGKLVDRVSHAWSETLAVTEPGNLEDALANRGVVAQTFARRRRGPATTFKFWAGASPGTGGGGMLETSV